MSFLLAISFHRFDLGYPQAQGHAFCFLPFPDFCLKIRVKFNSRRLIAFKVVKGVMSIPEFDFLAFAFKFWEFRCHLSFPSFAGNTGASINSYPWL